MPNNKDKKSSQPSLFQRLFGVMADDMPNDIKQSWETMQREMPDETAKTNRVTSMGPIGKLLNRGAYASANPFTNTIALNTDLMRNEKADVDSTLAHELAHIKQGPMGFLKNMFNTEPLEKEAYNTEELRRKRRLGFRKDINLPAK